MQRAQVRKEPVLLRGPDKGDSQAGLYNSSPDEQTIAGHPVLYCGTTPVLTQIANLGSK